MVLLVVLAWLGPLAVEPSWDRISRQEIELDLVNDVHARYIADEVVTPSEAGTLMFIHVAAMVTVLYVLPRRAPSLEVMNHAILALLFPGIVAYVAAAIVQRATLMPRPDFLGRCVPLGYVPSPVVYTIDELCTGDDDLIRDGLRNFPSAHSATLFATATIVWLMCRHTIQTWCLDANARLLLVFLNVLCSTTAVLVAGSRVLDHRHDWVAVFVGAQLGVFIGGAVFYLYYTRK